MTIVRLAVIQVADTGSSMMVSSQCPDYLDPEDLISTKWLHNKGWIPVSATRMTKKGALE
ncbi:WPE palindromic element domain-containing protein [Wolbachia endosymbiont (group A) of Anomoia purmunda]|uniref:WPE palindromic element domain-containing protein n=1 Tax=Wolbachia endosymbiont (group A) of Anomoia purmunda TaxID=2953978 RepID=UPI0022300684|nr:WPE palindromic element domain-containing protein [Wolbachia endosymbiont (group A) of Anomoia purmunda]